MNKKIFFSLAWLLCFGILFVGCNEANDDLPGQGSWSLEVIGADTDGSKNEAVIDMYGRYYSIYTTQKGDRDDALLLDTESDWLTLMADTLPADGILQFLAEENGEARERTATIYVVSASNPDRQTVITIRQRSESSYGENDSNPYSDFRVGFGFSAFDEFRSPRSVRGKVIDVSRLMLYDSDSTFNSTQEVLRGREDFTITNSWSLQEMSSKLTQEMISTTKFLGVKKTTRRFKEVATKDVREQACVYARLQKTVATRSIDGGVLRYLLGLSSDKLIHGLPFTAEFKEAYNAIINSTGENQTKAIQAMLDKYGTHLVTEASVGCMMDMTLTFDKSDSYDLESEAEQKSRSIFGRSSGNSSSTKTEHMTCNINNSNCIQIYGGSAKTRNDLENQVKTLTNASQLSPQLVEAWMASVTTSMLKDHRENLEVVDFHFIPIWELFSDPVISGCIQQQVIEMANRSDCSFTPSELSIDNYEIDLTNPELTRFSTGSNASLVRLARVNDKDNTPILEICQEYVPKICSDRRITVFYPVFGGMTRIGQGLFPGDGQGNPPAMLTFSDGDVFVNPIQGYGYRDVITKAYYIHGNLYTESYDMGIDKRTLSVEDEWLHLFNHKGVDGQGNYPVVKIGAGFWTRMNATDELGFEDKWGDSVEDIYQVNGQNMLFADVFYHVNSDAVNIANFTVNDQNHWYLPTSNDMNALLQYIGKNPKALFKNQMTGFEADFCGYIVGRDLKTGNIPNSLEIGYQGELCIIAFHDDDAHGSALILEPDYTWKTAKIYSDYRNRYPIRPYRTKNFKH